jgi:molybdopterin-guanine dinucleotide biosynthesis protein A
MHSAIEAVILAGGKGSRMQGQDKGLLDYQGKPLIAHVLQCLQQQQMPVQQIRINANRHLAQYASYGYPVIQDQMADFQGPLAGMQAGLSACQSELCLFVPCDTPFLPADLSLRMWQALQTAPAQTKIDIAIARSQQVHPVICLMRVSLLASLQQALAQGQRKVLQWQQQQAHCMVDFAVDGAQQDERILRNFNHPQDLLR